jgi:hypothetical protein
MMAPFAVLGAVIAVTLLAAMVRGPVGVKLAPYHLSYGIRVSDGFLIVALYVVAACGRGWGDARDAGLMGSRVLSRAAMPEWFSRTARSRCASMAAGSRYSLYQPSTGCRRCSPGVTVASDKGVWSGESLASGPCSTFRALGARWTEPDSF